jgi:hypothetical protein
MRHPLALTAAVAATLLAAPASHAALPKPKSTVIKPGSSIAGVKFGMDAQDALKLWGPGSNCEEVATERCTWRGSASQGSAYFEVRDGKVAEVGIDSGQKTTGDRVYRGPLVKWKDKKKIGLGSSLSATSKAYKKGFHNGGGWQLNSGSRATLWPSSAGRTYTIVIGLRANFE